MKPLNILLILITLFIIVRCLVFVQDKEKIKEKFQVSKFLQQQLINDDEYSQCVDKDAQLYYRSHGKYPDCQKAMEELTTWGMSGEDNIGYGKMKYICPVSCLLNSPTDCLRNKEKQQIQLIGDIHQSINDLSSQNPLHKMKIDTGLKNHQNHLDSLYQEQDVANALNYINQNVLVSSDPIYNEILSERGSSVPLPIEKTVPNIAPTPSTTLEPELTPPSVISNLNNNSGLAALIGNNNIDLGFNL